MTMTGQRFGLAVLLLAAAGCGAVGQEAKPVAELIAALDGDSREARLAAVDALGKMGPAAKDAVAPMSRLVLSMDPKVSQPAASALSRIDIEAMVALLMPRLTGGVEKVRGHAVKALEYVGPPATPFVKELTAAVATSPDGWTRAAAANGLGQIGPPAAEAVPVLIEGLQHPVEHVRRYCARGLGGIGAKAVAAIPELEKAAANEGEPKFAAWARESLDRIRKAQTPSP